MSVFVIYVALVSLLVCIEHGHADQPASAPPPVGAHIAGYHHSEHHHHASTQCGSTTPRQRRDASEQNHPSTAMEVASRRGVTDVPAGEPPFSGDGQDHTGRQRLILKGVARN